MSRFNHMPKMYSKKKNVPVGEKVPLKTVVKQTAISLPALFTPILLIGGIVFYVGQLISYFIYLFVTQKDNAEKIGKYFVYQVYQIILIIQLTHKI